MLRGHKALMGIVSDDVQIVSEKSIKGCFTDERNDALACRFYYYGHMLGKRYDVCLKALSKEFFISETVISQLLMKRQDYLKQLRLNNTTGKDLQKLYPFYTWN
jgi:hypothetical protein